MGPCHRAVGLAQLDGMDAFEPIAEQFPLGDIATLDELARLRDGKALGPCRDLTQHRLCTANRSLLQRSPAPASTPADARCSSRSVRSSRASPPTV